MTKTLKSALYIFLFSLIYAILRYHLFKGISWVQFPIYILNKAFALSAFLLFAVSFSVCPIQKLGLINLFKPEECKYLGWAGMINLFIHVIMSLLILNPVYFEKFYEIDGTLNLVGNLSFLLGVFGLVFILLYNSMFRDSMQNNTVANPFIKTNGFIISGLLVLCGHVFVMGVNGWLSPNEWPGYMPPISLIGFVVLFSSLTLNIFVIRK